MKNKNTLKNILILTVSMMILLSCSKQKYPKGLYAEINTEKGKIVVLLEYDKVPMTVTNFVGLTEGTIKNSALLEGVPYYNGSTFHRVVPDHVIQTGVPKDGSGEGLGYVFPNEIHPEFGHGEAGFMGMANGGPHTNSSHFYITLGDRSYLDGDYTVFGHVVEGMDVVFDIIQDDKIDSIEIIRIGRDAKRFKADTESFKKLVELAKIRVKKAEEKKREEETEIINRNWPGAITKENGIKYIVIKEGRGKEPIESAKLRIKYNGKFLDERTFYSSADKGKPVPDSPAVLFDFEVGSSTINPGFDETLTEMKKGEKRIIILPSRLAYGTSGFYGRSKKGEKRFVISPNTTLVYEIELIDIIP